MRLFQNSGIPPAYLHRLNSLAAQATTFDARRRCFLDDRFGALHFLQPVISGDKDAFFTNGDDEILQKLWAVENGMPPASSLEQILLAQIEQHRAEVFYNLDPVRYPSRFVEKLPGCVKKAICWRAVLSENADLSKYDLLLGNFPSIRADWEARGCRVAEFFPAIDPVMAEYIEAERPIDVLFVGGYSRYHTARAKTLERVAGLAGARNVVFCLDASRATRLGESALGRFTPLRKYRRPDSIVSIARPPVFGRGLYELLGRSKIVLNGAIDMGGTDRGNMRCFEAMGCGALLVSDAGNYPAGMEDGVTMQTYDSPDHAMKLIGETLDNWPREAEMAAEGQRRALQLYAKSVQWENFVALVGQA